MVVNKCFICDTNLESFQKRAIDLDHSSDSVLSEDLHVIFVLRNLFEIPREKVESYLAANYGNPSEWKFVCFCDHCGEAVENAKRIYQEMLDATKIFAAVKQEIVETVRRHWRRRKDSGNKESSSRKTGSVPLSVSDKLATKIVEETRQFIHNHPFVEGDLQASKLCSAKLAQEGCQKSESIAKNKSDFLKECARVKNEPITSEDEDDLSRLYMTPNDLEVDIESQLCTSPLADNHAKPYEASVNKEGLSSGSEKSKRAFFKVKDLKNQLKQIYQSGTRPSMSKTSKSAPPKMKFKFEFENCGRFYESRGKLALHLLKHYENKPFHCDWPNCNSKFSEACNLRRHKLLHNEEAFVFKCSLCTKKFTRNDTLQGHKKRCHGTTSQ